MSKTLYLIDNNYDTRFNTYKKNCNQDKISLELLNKILTNLSKTAWANKNTINFLDLGCGEGGLTVLITENIKNIFSESQINLCAIDKSSFLLEELRVKISEISKNNNISIETRKADIFERIHYLDIKFDIVMCSHVFYYSKDLKNDLINIKKLLKPEGILCIVHESERSDFKKLRKKYNTSKKLNKDFTENTMENILNGPEFNTVKYQAKACVKFPENAHKFLRVNNSVIYDEKSIETTKSLLEFVLHQPIDNLYDENVKNNFLDDVIELLLKQENCLYTDNDFFVVLGNEITHL